MPRPTILLALLALALPLHAAVAPPKRLLVVGASARERHGSIPNAEKLLRELAAASNGRLALTFMSDAPDYPFSRITVPAAAARGGFPGGVPSANAAQRDAITLAGVDLVPLATAVTAARNQLVAATFNQPTDIGTRVQALANAETTLALARADALGRIQASSNRLSREQAQALGGLNAPPPAAVPGGRGAAPAPPAEPSPDQATLARLFQQQLSPAALQNYDGIIFVSSTGPLPFPDQQAFHSWVAGGKAVIGLHAAVDWGYQLSDQPFVALFTGGARYASAPGGGILPRQVYRADPRHPASSAWPDGLAVVDEFFQFSRPHPTIPEANVPGLDRAAVHVLLEMDYEGERLPLAWTRTAGRGRVFYTALGHRDDVLLPDTPSGDYGGAKVNPNAVSTAYRQHLLGGILWSVGLAE